MVESRSHAARKVSAVSRSSISSAAVASILAREKSLMGRAPSIRQVLFCAKGTKKMLSIIPFQHSLMRSYLIINEMRSDLDGDGEGVHEVIRYAIRVPGGVNSHRYKLTLRIE